MTGATLPCTPQRYFTPQEVLDELYRAEGMVGREAMTPVAEFMLAQGDGEAAAAASAWIAGAKTVSGPVG